VYDHGNELEKQIPHTIQGNLRKLSVCLPDEGHGIETLLNELLSPLQVGIVYRISFSSLF